MPKKSSDITEELLENEQNGAGVSLADPVNDVDFSRKKEEVVEIEDDDYPFGEWSRDTVENKPFKALLYGPSGAGKTWYAATFPKPLFLDLEGGLRTTFQVGSVLRYPADPREEVKTLDEVREFYTLVRRDKKPRYETIVIDSLNELQLLVTADVVKSFTSSGRQMEDQLTLQDYGKVNRDFLAIVRKFLKMPYHIVMTAVQTDPAYEGALVFPKFTGKQIWPELQRMVEQIGYVNVVRGDSGKLEHMVSYQLTPSYVAKDRLAIEERWLPNNFDYLLKYANQE